MHNYYAGLQLRKYLRNVLCLMWAITSIIYLTPLWIDYVYEKTISIYTFIFKTNDYTKLQFFEPSFFIPFFIVLLILIGSMLIIFLTRHMPKYVLDKKYPYPQYKGIENYVLDGVVNIISKIKNFLISTFSNIFERKMLTVMFIPHSERKIANAYTGSFRTPIPEIKGQLFRLKKDTCSGNKRTLSAGAPE